MSARGERIRVLHVEDDDMFADLTSAFLERADEPISVLQAREPEDGLEILERETVDCIVSDYDLPGSDGIAFLEAVRERDERLPFILFTGKGSEEVASEALSAGATDYLQKEGGRDQFHLLVNRITNAVEQYEADQKRRASEQRYRQLLSTAPMPILVYGPDGRVRYANDAAVDYLNADSQSHLRGQPALEISHPDDRDLVKDRLQTMLDDGEPVPPVEQRAVTLDGEVKHGVVASAPVTTQDKPAIQSIIYDTTQRKEAEERLEALAESFPDIAFIIDEDGRHVESLSGPSSEQLLVGEAEGLVGTTLSEVMPEETAQRLLETVRESLESREPRTVEYQLEVQAGTRWFEGRVAPLQSNLDGKRAVTLVSRDVTDRKNREQELEEQNQRLERLADERAAAETRYRSLFENNPVVIWEDDATEAKAYVDELASEVDDVEAYLEANPEELSNILEKVEIIDVNQRAVEYYEAESKAQVKENLESLMTEQGRAANRRLWAAIARGEREFRTEITTKTFEGGLRHEIFEMRVPEAYAEDFSRMFLTAVDITERVNRERELERQNERLEEFTSVVSHDLRNPLNVADGRLALAQDECDSDHLTVASDALDRMGALIDDLLVMARQGQSVGEVERVDLGTLIEECWQNVATGEATLEVDVSNPIEADRSRLQQLLENLLRNAVEHAGPDVTVRIEELDDGAGFAVLDDGPGIPEDDLNRIFRSGYSTSETGTGFGLAIVRDIAEAHGWSVSAANRETGGARIEFRGVDAAAG